MYKIQYKKMKLLPKLAWIADVDKTTNQMTVICGEKVECFNNFFVTGVWDGDFEKGEFDNSSCFFGTGCQIKDDKLIFVTPSHSLERLQYYETDKTFSVSNSLAMLMSYCDLSLDPLENQYESYFCSILDGLKKYKQYIPMKDNKYIRQVIVSSIILYNYGKAEVICRSKDNKFTSFEQYYNRMMKSMTKVRNNATSPLRKSSKFGIVSTISSGYDSTCCSVIAKHLGCDCVVSLAGGSYDNDNGVKVAQLLNYSNIIRRDKDDYKTKLGLIDAEYISSGEMGTMLQFCVFEDVFSDNLVFFGTRGSYWEKKIDMTEDFEMDNYFYYETDISWTENALRNGYIPIPLPTFGGSVCYSIRNISNSPEMAPWNLGIKYDKPIPRRIVESAGVPRDAFGQKKYGGGFYLGYETTNSLNRKLSYAGYSDFNHYRKEYHCVIPLKRVVCGIKYFKCLFPTYFCHALAKIGLNIKLKQKAPRISNPFSPSVLFFWSIDVMKGRYKEQMDSLK